MAGYSRLRRNSSQRRALLRDLVTDLIIHGQIETTEAKAKELSKLADKMVTLGKKGTLDARRQALTIVRNELVKEGQTAVQKLFGEIAPKFKDRNGGYTRVIKTLPRLGDSAPMAIIQFVE
jgi:large subunit ribosomal protein L17